MSHVSLSAILALTVPGAALAQCQPEWLPTPPHGALEGGVIALASFRGDLIAAGYFEAPGTLEGHIVRWDGEFWQPVGPRLDDDPPSLFVHDDYLIASGIITWAGGQHAFGMARWDGRDWSPMMSNPPAWAPYVIAVDTVVHDGILIAAGEHFFYNQSGWGGLLYYAARWDGAIWRPLGPPTVNPPAGVSLVSHGGDLFAAVNDWAPPAGRVVRWDGEQWVMTAPLVTSWWNPKVGNLAVYGGQVVAAGPGYPVQVWDGSAWSELGAPAPRGWGLIPYRGELFTGVVGVASSVAATWNGSTWRYLPHGPLASISVTTVHDGVLVAGSYDWPYWARWGCPCYADCDKSGGVSVADFGCFQTQFVLGHPYTDCNGDEAMTAADFGCFQTKFVGGCR